MVASLKGPHNKTRTQKCSEKLLAHHKQCIKCVSVTIIIVSIILYNLFLLLYVEIWTFAYESSYSVILLLFMKKMDNIKNLVVNGTVWITINCGKFCKRWEYQTT